MQPTQIPIWLDCDPGHDDTVAILLGCFHPAFQILGISASYGNASGANTTYNARSLLTAIGRAEQVPVYSGAMRPWIRCAEYAPDIHGESGLDGTELLPVPTCGLQDGSYLDAMEKAILDHEGAISIVVTGPLTSLATLLKQRPYLKPKIKFISIMGGGIEAGNRNDNNSGEFNIWIDPESANFIFQDPQIKDKCILLALDITHKAIATDKVVAAVRGTETICTNLRQLFFELFQFFANSYKGAQGFEAGPPLHDPLTLIPLLEFYGWAPASVVQFEYKRLDLAVVEDSLSPDLGRTCPIREYTSGENSGTIVGMNTNMNFFWEQVLGALAAAEKCSTIE